MWTIVGIAVFVGLLNLIEALGDTYPFNEDEDSEQA